MINSHRTFGIEIEFMLNGNSTSTVISALNAAGVDAQIEGYNHTTQLHWKMVTDATIGSGGRELVSPILKGTDGLAQLKKVCDTLNSLNCSIARRCGLHVHHGINELSESSVVSLFKNYARHETKIDSVMPQSRRSRNNMVRSLRPVRSAIDAALGMNGLKSALGTRYRKLNIESYWRYGTVEFRHHSGTIEYSKIKNWVIFGQKMIEKSIEGDIVARNLTGLLSALFSGSSAPVRNIMQRGIAKLAKECFENGVTDRAEVLSIIKSAHPEAKTNLRRVTSYHKMWSENQTASSGDGSALVDFYTNRAAALAA